MVVRPFFKFKQRSICRREVLDFVEGAPEQFWERPAVHLPTHLVLPPSLFEKDEVFSRIVREYSVGHRIKAFRFAPRSTYNWHRDGNFRSTAINFQLNCFGESGMFFGDGDKEAQAHSNLELLTYEPDCFYLVDLQTSHMVVNLSEKTRYMVTVGFTVPYPDVCRSLFREFEATHSGSLPRKASEV